MKREELSEAKKVISESYKRPIRRAEATWDPEKNAEIPGSLKEVLQTFLLAWRLLDVIWYITCTGLRLKGIDRGLQVLEKTWVAPKLRNVC